MIDHSTLAAWEAFYVIVGSSAAALTGLQFVVIALISESAVRRSSDSIAAFGTPTIVHFCAVLLIAGILSAPWGAPANAAIPIGLCGALGIVYALIVARRARRTTIYKPVLEDWIWHAFLPLIAYADLVAASVALPRLGESALFAIAAAALLLLFIGIHNAWDSVTYVAVGIHESTPESPAQPEQIEPPRAQ